MAVAATKIWMDGVLVDGQDATVHVLTHTLHYGLGVFEEIRCYQTDDGPAIFRLGEHLEHLFASAHICRLRPPCTREEARAAILETVRVNGLAACHIRTLIYLGHGPMGLNPRGNPVRMAIAVWAADERPARETRVKTSSFVRQTANLSMNRATVCGNYATLLLGKLEAMEDGYDGALFLDAQGNVAEGLGENIFVVERGSLVTPPAAGILPGVTRDSVVEIARWLGIDVREAAVSRDAAWCADEVFFTGTATELTPVCEVDRRTIGSGVPGPVTCLLAEHYGQVVRGKVAPFTEWLTPVGP